MRNRRHARWLLAAGTIALIAGGWAFVLPPLGAQALPGTAAQPPAPVVAPAPRAPQTPAAPIIVANSDLVNMVFTVQDKHGAFVPGLRRADFRVLDDGRPQTIQFFSAQDQLPLTLGLLLDTSPSQAGILGEEQQISDDFFQRVITPKDLAFVIGFDVNVSLLQDLTASVAQLQQAVGRAHIGGGGLGGLVVTPGPFPTQGNVGSTHLWDAIYLACHDELAHQVGRKAIIVVTDGGEQGSTYTEQDALRAALNSNTIVFAIIATDHGYAGYGPFGPGPGPEQLRSLAEQTGGRSINAGVRLGPAFAAIEQELRSQYSLAYRPEPSGGGYGFHSVRIALTRKVADGAKVRARAGYYPVVSSSRQR